jgi:putative ABC transport system permease protein
MPPLATHDIPPDRRLRPAEALRIALAAVGAQRLRSAFAMTGVAIGVAFLIAVVSIVEGIDRYVRENLIGRFLGANTVELRPVLPTPSRSVGTAGRGQRSRRSARRAASPLLPADVAAVAAALPSGVDWAVETAGPVTISSPGKRARTVVAYAVGGDYIAARRAATVAGRPLTPQEAASDRAVAVVGQQIARWYFPNTDPVGLKITIAGIPYLVVGVWESQGTMLGISLDEFVVVPSQAPVRRVLLPRRGVGALIINARSPGEAADLRERVRHVMRGRHGLRVTAEDDFEITTAESVLAFWRSVKRPLAAAGAALPGIALVVAGVVIANIMLMGAAERRHEIGVRRAVGASKRDVFAQFLLEAVAISTAGAMLGVVVGWLGARVIATASPLPAATTPGAVSLAIAVGMFVGAVAGTYPALRAARLNPVAVLRQE